MGSDSLSSAPPGVAWWQHPIRHEVDEHLALDRMTRYEI
jgi:hypothetical protein